ncbi:MAG: hypothetical protein HQL16_06770 [Candidatus Omnitrophica bacterium]|nr:hypothetical protein [Candidatus Omnitrophota bacterium]
MNRFLILICLCASLGFVGCSSKSSDETRERAVSKSPAVQAKNVPAVSPGSPKAFQPFYVYQDKNTKNRFTPSGYMPTGECISLDDGWQYDPQEGRTCTRVVYDVTCSREGRKWAGIYWQNPPDNWGSRKGGYNLTGASRLVFWAKGEIGGERIEEFRVGGMGQGQNFPDSDTAFIGPVLLTNEWKEYSIDLRGHDLSYISGGFEWVANVDNNPHHCTFYLDNIHFE